MKLYVPKIWDMPIDIAEDETPMTLVDMLTLKEIMECFKDFDELKKAVSKYSKSYNLECRYKFTFVELPDGSVRDWFYALVNVFGDEGVRRYEGKAVPQKLMKSLVTSRMQEELNCSERIARERLRSLLTGHYIEEEYGCIVFPKHMLLTKDLPRGRQKVLEQEMKFS